MGGTVEAVRGWALGLGIVGGIFASLAGLLLTLCALGVVSLYLSGKLVGARRVSIGGAVVVGLLGFVAYTGFGVLFSVVPFVGTTVGWLAGVAVQVKLVESFFGTETPGAIGCVFLHFVISTVLAAVLIAVLSGGVMVASFLFG